MELTTTQITRAIDTVSRFRHMITNDTKPGKHWTPELCHVHDVLTSMLEVKGQSQPITVEHKGRKVRGFFVQCGNITDAEIKALQRFWQQVLTGNPDFQLPAHLCMAKEVVTGGVPSDQELPPDSPSYRGW